MDPNASISPRLRAHLLALGIPPAQHSAAQLGALFPREFNVGATDMDAEELAKVLVHFVERKLFSLPTSGVPSGIRKVGPGWHFCQFYRDNAQLVALIAPYIAEGLKNDEGCLWVMPRSVATHTAREALAQHVANVDAHVASGQLEMLSHPDWYLDASGRLKSFEEIAAALLEKQEQALARGFRFLRAAGDTGWVSGTEQSKEFIDYEQKINAALGSTKVAAICTYRADVTADEFIAIVSAHQDALYT